MEQGRIRLLLREAISSAKAGNKEWARDCLSRVIRIDPRNEDAWLWLSAVLDAPAEKRFCLEKVLSINPRNAQALQGLQWMDRQAQAEAGLIVEVERTVCPMCGEPNPTTAFRCSNCGQDLFVRCPRCTERVDIDRTSCTNCELELGDSSDGPAFFFHLGELYLEHGDPKRALDAWDKTILLKPDYPRVAEVAAEAFFASGRNDLAVQSMQQAILEAEEERRRTLILRLAAMHRELKHLEEASKIYQDLLQADQERHEPQADVYTELGRLYQVDKDFDSARHHYEMALALDESLHEVRFILTELLLEEGYEVQALRQLRWLQAIEGEVAERASARIDEVRPPIPEAFRNRWQETMRGVGRYSLVGVVLLMLSLGRWLGSMSTWNLLGLVAFAVAGYFLTAATTTPRNLPTFEHLSGLAEGPLGTRLRRRGRSAAQAGWFQRFLTWQRRSTRSMASNLRLFQRRFNQWLQRTGQTLSRNWNRFKAGRAMRAIRALPQCRVFRTLAAWGQKPFFRALARFFSRISGRLFRRPAGVRTGPSLVQRLGQAIRDQFKQLIQRISQIEISEMQIYRWMAALLGALLLVLGGGLILFF